MNKIDEFDWTKPINLNLALIRCVGLWPKGEFYKFDSYGVYAVTVAIVLLGGHNLSSIINIFYVYNDLEALTATIFIGSTNFLAAIKMYLFVRNMRLIKQLFVTLNSKEFRPKSLEQIDLVQPTVKTLRTLYYEYSFIAYNIIFLWSITPVLSKELGIYRLPFEARYPFDVKSPRNYKIAYFYQLICIWPITAANINLDYLFFAVLIYIGGQCDILYDDLKKLEDDASFNKKFIECVKHHKAILKFVTDSNNFFNLIIAGQIATSTGVLALTMFKLSHTSPLSGEGMGHLTYINGISFQIGFYCWYGNEIAVKSSQFIYAVYQSKWLNQPETVKKNILIFSIRCQRPIQITAIDLFDLSVQTFIGILRTAWSYFAVLNSVSED